MSTTESCNPSVAHVPEGYISTITHCIGRPWLAGGRGPNAFDCWGLFLHIQRECFARTLPEIPIDAYDLKAVLHGFRDHPERARWQRIDPCTGLRSGDAVLMRQSRHPVHVGVWLDFDGAGVLHCLQGTGVVFQHPQQLALHGWQVEGYYRFKDDIEDGICRA